MTRLSPVTAVVACYNHVEFVESALRSVFDQTHPEVDVVITDDASTDGSQQRIREVLDENRWRPKAIIFHDENRGICRTFNEALAEADTPFIAIMSADDSMQPDRLRRQVEFAEKLDDSVAVYHTDAQIINDDGPVSGLTWHSHFKIDPNAVNAAVSRSIPDLILTNPVVTASVMLRTEAVRAIGGWDERLSFEDFDMWLRLSRCYQFAFLDEPLTNYRVGLEGSLSKRMNTDGRLVRDLPLILEKHFGQSAATDQLLRERIYGASRVGFLAGKIDAQTAARRMMPHAV